jgi:hypothetical protein
MHHATIEGDYFHITLELSQGYLMAIFATLEIPDMMGVTSVCSSWNSAAGINS